MPQWVRIVEHERDQEMELQVETDGTILLQNIKNVFPSVTTLKYRNPENNAWRVIKCVDDVLYPPEDDGWLDLVYVVVVPKGQEQNQARVVSADTEDKRSHGPVNKAIYVLFDSENLTKDDLREYFGEFGTITNLNCMISKKFAFITFDDENVPLRLYGKPVSINGVELDIKEPESDEKEFRKLALLYKEDKITNKQIREFFEQYGEVTDVYVTRPFRKYGFVTFSKAQVARDLYDQNVKIEGVKVFLTKPRPKMDKSEKREFGGSGSGTSGGHHYNMMTGRGRSEDMSWGVPNGIGGGGFGFSSNSKTGWAQYGNPNMGWNQSGMGNLGGGF